MRDDAYHNVRFSSRVSFDAVDPERLGTQSEGAETDRVQEGRCVLNQNRVSDTDDLGRENRLVDKPETRYKVVNPVGCFGVSLQAVECEFTLDIVAYIATQSADRSLVVRS